MLYIFPSTSLVDFMETIFVVPRHKLFTTGCPNFKPSVVIYVNVFIGTPCCNFSRFYWNFVIGISKFKYFVL